MNLADGQFHHVAMTFQSSINGGTTIYADGLQVLTTTITVLTQYRHLRLAKETRVLSSSSTGIICEAKLYNRALTSGEIHANFNAGEG